MNNYLKTIKISTCWLNTLYAQVSMFCVAISFFWQTFEISTTQSWFLMLCVENPVLFFYFFISLIFCVLHIRFDVYIFLLMYIFSYFEIMYYHVFFIFWKDSFLHNIYFYLLYVLKVISLNFVYLHKPLKLIKDKRNTQIIIYCFFPSKFRPEHMKNSDADCFSDQKWHIWIFLVGLCLILCILLFCQIFFRRFFFWIFTTKS